jgi:hypothetical protein
VLFEVLSGAFAYQAMYSAFVFAESCGAYSNLARDPFGSGVDYRRRPALVAHPRLGARMAAANGLRFMGLKNAHSAILRLEVSSRAISRPWPGSLGANPPAA